MLYDLLDINPLSERQGEYSGALKSIAARNIFEAVTTHNTIGISRWYCLSSRPGIGTLR
jgi:hypothetical protein